jgi:hypothetical protein
MTEVEDIRRDFKTSRRFGIIGVVVVMVVVAALALAFGSNNAHPTVLMAVIFAIVFGFVAVLMFLQRRDLSGAEARSTRAAVAAAGPVTDPTTADANALIHDLAIKPVDDAAIAESTSRMWSITRGSMNSAIPLMVLIACAVIPWQLFTAYWSLYVFVPIIVLYVAYLAIRVIMPGGTLDQAYDSSAPTLDALGLAQVERPEIGIRPRVARPGLEKRVSGEIEYAGARHGRQVTVRIPADGGGTTTTLTGSFEELKAAARGERLIARPGAPMAVNAVLDPLRASSYWKGVEVTAGADGLVVERKRGGGQHWMRDLWLAERLADALSSRA